MFAIKSKINHDSMWMKFFDGKQEVIRLSINRGGEAIKYLPSRKDIATKIWNDFQNCPDNMKHGERFNFLVKKYGTK